MKITFTINNKQISKEIKPSLLLIDLIRDELKLKGTKPGCMEGECGACTVLVDGKAINSCLYLAVNINGKHVTTIEGLSLSHDDIDKVQKAIIQHGAVQCGFCTPGMVMSIKSFISQWEKEGCKPTKEEIAKNLEGNLCRCTGYVKIIEAVDALV